MFTWKDVLMGMLGWSALVLVPLVIAAIAYLCGCFNGAIIVSKYILRDDVRTHGSGNAGLTNFHRTFGGKLTAVVLLLDVLKMVAAIFLSLGILVMVQYVSVGGAIFVYVGHYHFQFNQWWELDPNLVLLAKYWAGTWCLLGHMFPATFDFKGGKGVLSGVTLMFCLDWRMGLIALGLFIAAVVLTRYISLGSCLGAVSFPVGTWLFVTRDNWIVLSLSVLLGALVVFMHRGNLRRMVKGEERKFSLHHKDKK